MSGSPNTDWTKTIAWPASASTAHLAECHKSALQQQQELFEDAQQRLAARTRRRQEALETGMSALARMSSCKTPVEAAAIYGEWMSGSISRIMADMDDAQAHAAKMAEKLQKASQAVFETAPRMAADLAPTANLPQPVVAGTPAPQDHLREAAD